MFGSIGVLNTDGERIECHLCGKWSKGLGCHAWRSHSLTADDYRERFGLRYGTSLLAPESSERLSCSIREVMSLDRLAANRAKAVHPVGGGHKRRMESLLDPKYQRAQRAAVSAMRAGFDVAKSEGRIPEPSTAHMNVPDVRRKAIKTRMQGARWESTKAKIRERLKEYYASHRPQKRPPITEETRLRMSEAAKRRGVNWRAVEKARATNKERCAKMTPEERRAMFKGTQA